MAFFGTGAATERDAEHVVEIAGALTAAESEALATMLRGAMGKSPLLFSFFGAGIAPDVKQSLQRKLSAARIRATAAR